MGSSTFCANEKIISDLSHYIFDTILEYNGLCIIHDCTNTVKALSEDSSQSSYLLPSDPGGVFGSRDEWGPKIMKEMPFTAF